MIRPGAGLILLALVSAASIAFFAWGLATPPLEEVYTLQLQLELGSRGPLAKSERKLIEDALRRHPALAENWVGVGPFAVVSKNQGGLVETGYAYVLRKKPTGAQVLELSATDAKIGKPIPIVVRAGAKELEGEVKPGEAFTWALPNEGEFPQLVEVRITTEKKKKIPALIVRLKEQKP